MRTIIRPLLPGKEKENGMLEVIRPSFPNDFHLALQVKSFFLPACLPLLLFVVRGVIVRC